MSALSWTRRVKRKEEKGSEPNWIGSRTKAKRKVDRLKRATEH